MPPQDVHLVWMSRVVQGLGLALVLAALWLLLSGHFFEPLLLGFGAASVVFVVWIVRRMDMHDHQALPISVSWRILFYWPWLLKEIVLANYDVARAILGHRITPTVFRVRASQRSDMGRVIYANSITLTPGTVTIGVAESVFTIHALTPGAMEGLEGGEMDRRCRELEV
jgi:multicomponent Na+:H+ antiporter subunit E